MDIDRLEDRRLGFVIKEVQHALRKEMDRRLGEADLTTAQYAAMTALEHDDGMSNAELARRCFVTPQTMHKVVERLEERGLVERSAHPTHGRIRLVDLTENGRDQLEQAHGIVDDIEALMTAEVTDEEAAVARRVLLKCVTSLEESDSDGD